MSCGSICVATALQEAAFGPLCPLLCATVELDMAPPQRLPQPSDLNTSGGSCLNPLICSAAHVFPPASGEADREDSPQEALQTASGYACKPSASQAPQSSCFQEETHWVFLLNQVLSASC